MNKQALLTHVIAISLTTLAVNSCISHANTNPQTHKSFARQSRASKSYFNAQIKFYCDHFEKFLDKYDQGTLWVRDQDIIVMDEMNFGDFEAKYLIPTTNPGLFKFLEFYMDCDGENL